MSARQAATREHIGGNLDRHRRIASFGAISAMNLAW
jgi:hypothetical protein